MGVAERSEVREEAGRRGPEAAEVAPSSPGLAAVALSLQRSAGNRSTATWALAASRHVQRKPKPKDPIDTFITGKQWAKAADAMSELPDGEIETRIKKLKPAQREGVMQGAREIERTAWTEPVITAMEKVDLRSANVGSLRWARASGFIARAGIWFKGLAVEDARKVAHELAFSPRPAHADHRGRGRSR
jgi:hypothetical protein